ncbi:putative cytochrome P450 4aa1 [Orchesella cincta]|uniref:Putative cytochrome P450 4aa1 n=1 Tax=Orchesella cincta TaxID=48709 RepID=A0A1D2M8A9_ORCCI|nr:putative cytochrome P450 4aa1 [Orchesella cincta]
MNSLVGLCNNGELQRVLIGIALFMLGFAGTRAYWKGRSGSLRKTKRLHGPGGSLLGPLMNVLALRNTKTTLNVLENWCRIYGPVFKLRFGPMSFIMLNSPQYFQKLLGSTDVNHHHKGFIYEPIRPALNDGLIISTGEKWKRRRKLISKHMFNHKTFVSYISIFNDEANQIVKALQETGSGTEVNVSAFLIDATLNAITKASIGKPLADCESLVGDNIGIAELVSRFKEIVAKRVMKPWLLYDPVWRLHPLSKVESFLSKISWRQMSYAISSNNSLHEGKKTSLREYLVEEGVPIEGILEETATLLSAGYETTETSLQFLLFLLALNPYHQGKCREEVDSVFSDNFDDDLEYCDLSKLKHLEMCVFETLRLFPVVFLIMRKLKAPLRLCKSFMVKIKIEGFGFLGTEEDLEIAAGTEVAMFIPGIHKNPNIFPNPNEFIPERFSQENCRHRSPYAFVPFSAGPRKCIGYRFAIMELMCLTAKLLRHFVISTTDKYEEIVVLPHLTLTLDKPINFSFEIRDFVSMQKGVGC